MDEKHLTLQWQQKSRKPICKTKVMTVVEQRCIAPDNTEGTYIVMDAPDWVVTVPVIEQNGEKFFVIVEQWRHGTNAVSLEFPGGVVDKGEAPEKTAARELLEETGYKAGNIEFLGSVSPNPAIMANRVHFYAATQLENTYCRHLDADEFIRFMLVPETEIYAKMGKEPYTHALMCAAYDMYRRFSKSL
ncbi:MAG: NUDIX hydrolase [Bacteroides sp.]|nr:NUDIX hydrolase [Prevotella sp.]MCM1408787.1 NUDIX hydrolase [Treponema brennaborense]MCM1470567.1 NUDIX hydrolase [Bacteroides sp.]